MGDYLDHLAVASLNQSQGFQFNAGELRPRLASQFEPVAPGWQMTALSDWTEENLEAESADRVYTAAHAASMKSDTFSSLPQFKPPIRFERPSQREDKPIHRQNSEAPSPEGEPAVWTARESSDDSAQVLDNASLVESHLPRAGPVTRSHQASAETLAGARPSPAALRNEATRAAIIHQPVGSHDLRRDRSAERPAAMRAQTEIARLLDVKRGSLPMPPIRSDQTLITPRDEVGESVADSRNRARGDGEIENAQNVVVDRRGPSIDVPYDKRTTRHTDASPAASNRANRMSLSIAAQLRSNLARREDPADGIELSDEPTINVTIGRVEVRAVPAPSAPTSRTRAAPVMTLEEYLRRRTSGGGS